MIENGNNNIIKNIQYNRIYVLKNMENVSKINYCELW